MDTLPTPSDKENIDAGCVKAVEKETRGSTEIPLAVATEDSVLCDLPADDAFFERVDGIIQ
jgi:hypothetical protein